MMRQVFLPDESEERVHRAHTRRMRARLAALLLLLAIAAVAYVVFGPGRAVRQTLADGFRSEVVPRVPIIGPEDSAWAARRAPYRIQVAAVPTRERASALATKLRVEGWNVDVVEDSTEQRFRVEVGPYVSRAEAEAVSRTLRNGYGPGVILVERR
jgi:hypothetical protein